MAGLAIRASALAASPDGRKQATHPWDFTIPSCRYSSSTMSVSGLSNQGFLFGSDDGHVAPAEVSCDVADLARDLPSNLRFGTSSWSFPGWEGLVYGGANSKTMLASHGLRAYARHPLFRSVGVDRTFYSPVEAHELAAYRDAVADGFRFLVKAHSDCVNPPDARAEVRVNVQFDSSYVRDRIVGPVVEGMGSKAGVILFQFTPRASSSTRQLSEELDRLHRMLIGLPTVDGLRYAVELRDGRMFNEQYAGLLKDANACHCFSVHPSVPDLGVQAELCPPGEQGAIVVRWMLHAGFAYEEARRRYEPFDRLVDPDPRSRQLIAGLSLEGCSPGAGRPGDREQQGGGVVAALHCGTCAACAIRSGGTGRGIGPVRPDVGCWAGAGGSGGDGGVVCDCRASSAPSCC